MQLSGNTKNIKETGGLKNKASKPMVAVIIVLLVALLGVALFIIYLLTRLEERPAERALLPEARGVIVTPYNVDEIREWLETPVEDAHFTVSMNSDWVFERWNTPSINAHVENSTFNTRTVYFDLVLRETGELIFSSPFLPVGAVLDQVTLNTRLEPGIHPASVVYHLVDDDFNELTSVVVAVTLQILQ